MAQNLVTAEVTILGGLTVLAQGALLPADPDVGAGAGVEGVELFLARQRRRDRRVQYRPASFLARRLTAHDRQRIEAALMEASAGF